VVSSKDVFHGKTSYAKIFAAKPGLLLLNYLIKTLLQKVCKMTIKRVLLKTTLDLFQLNILYLTTLTSRCIIEKEYGMIAELRWFTIS